jgi:hypothetical protein
MSSSTTKAAGQSKEAAPAAATATETKPRRKPRKLNKEPTSTSTPTTAKAPPDPTSELEALKSRIRSLESKVEDLYKTTDARPGRSPRRRGKGRKNSSSTTTATLGNLSQEARAHEQGGNDDEEEADEELIRLEGELDGARRELANYRPRSRRTTTTPNDADDVEEVPRATDGAHPDRHVTLSGSYRIPLPASVNMDDVKTIQSGVSAAQSVARRVLEQRRAAAAIAKQNSSAAAGGAAPGMEVVVEGGAAPAAEKKGWGEWIGGYSMAISRAVKSIEHEAAMEGQGRAQGQGQGQGGNARSKVQGARKRPAPPRTALSGEQVQGLMG